MPKQGSFDHACCADSDSPAEAYLGLLPTSDDTYHSHLAVAQKQDVCTKKTLKRPVWIGSHMTTGHTRHSVIRASLAASLTFLGSAGDTVKAVTVCEECASCIWPDARKPHIHPAAHRKVPARLPEAFSQVLRGPLQRLQPFQRHRGQLGAGRVRRRCRRCARPL